MDLSALPLHPSLFPRLETAGMRLQLHRPLLSAPPSSASAAAAAADAGLASAAGDPSGVPAPAGFLSSAAGGCATAAPMSSMGCLSGEHGRVSGGVVGRPRAGLAAASSCRLRLRQADRGVPCVLRGAPAAAATGAGVGDRDATRAAWKLPGGCCCRGLPGSCVA